MRQRILLVIFLTLLASCGGGSDINPYQQLIDQASAKQAQARSLAVDSPCQQTNQCGVLTFLEATTCPTSTYKIYSTVSPTSEAAKAAAGEQVLLAQQALALAPHVSVACPLYAVMIPTPVCVANQCQAAVITPQ